MIISPNVTRDILLIIQLTFRFLLISYLKMTPLDSRLKVQNYRLVSESIPWLIAENRYDEAYKVIQKAVSWNKIQIPAEANKLQVRHI